jgi:hypothetical protein
MRYIAILLLLTTTLSAQTKWRQIERSLVKWNVPAAYDSIPGQTGYAGKWISLVALLDSINYTAGGGIKGSGATDQVTYWAASDSVTGSNNLKWSTNNLLDITGRIELQVTTTSGNWNAFINGGNTTLTGVRNIAIGSNQTLSAITTGESNLALGSVSGFKTTTGSDNVYLGYLSGYENATGSNNMFIGAQSGYSTTGSDNVYVGGNAGRQGGNVTRNTYIGTFAGYNGNNSNNVSIGYYSSFNTSNTGQYNTVIGNAASQNGGGDNSVKIGTLSGFGNTGSNNVFIGFESGRETSSKGGNIFIGYGAGRNEDIDNSLIIANSTATNNGIYGDFDTNKFGVNVAPSSITRTLDINGELRVRDLTTDSPTLVMGADSDGDVASITVGNGLTLASSTLRADTSVLATHYDLTLLDPSITNEIQTIDTFQIFDTNKLRISLTQDNEPAKVVTLPTGGGGIDSTIVVGGWGIDVAESPANTFTVKADTSEVATAYDLTLKQDKLVSGTNIKTVNSNSLLGTGNISVGTVTSIATSAPISGGTITGTGTIGLNYDGSTLTLSGSNLAARNGSAIWNANQLQNTTIQSSLSPNIGEVLTYTASNQWESSPPSAGTTNLTMTGASSPFTLNSDTGTDVTFAAGTGISLTRSSNELTIASTLTAPQTWGDFTTNIQSWGSTGSFGSGKDVGIGGQPTRDFDVIGDARLRGAIYNSSNSAGSSGQVLTSQGTSAWTWTTPASAATDLTFSGASSPYTLNSSSGTDVTFTAGSGIGLSATSGNITLTATDASATNELQTISTSGAAGNITLSNSGGTLNLNVNDADANATNEAQTLSLGSNGAISLSAISGVGGGTATIPQATYGILYNTGNLSTITLDGTERELTFTAGQGNNTTVSTANESITILTAGTYKIEYNGSFKTDSPFNQNITIKCYNNGSSIGYIGELRTKDTEGSSTNNMTSFSRSFISDLSANDVIELYYVKTTGTDATISFFNLNLMVQRIN